MKCDLTHHINQEQRCNPRPTNDTFSPSPNNLFHIHYNTSGSDAPSQTDNDNNGIPDYVDEVALAAEYSLDIFINQLGYNNLVPDDDGIYDIYIDDRGSGSYGINYIDLDQQCIPLGGSSWVEIDNEYEQGEYYTTGLDAMKVTIAHELFHAIQRSYQISPALSTLFLYEMSSTWVEDIVYPNINDYIYWTDNFFDNPEQSIDETNGYSIALYGHYLTSEFNDSIIREIWERFSIYNNATSSIEYVIDNNYSSSFIETWVDFCSRNLFNGQYTNMNNGFYYYIDQIYADPLTFSNPEVMSGVNEFNIYMNDIILHDDEVKVKLFEPDADYTISNVSTSSSNVLGNFVLSSVNLSNQDIVSIENNNIFVPTDQIYMILANSNGSTVADIDISVTDCPFLGDPNFDCQLNVLDVLIIIDIILGNYNGGQNPSNDVIQASDLDSSGDIGIIDIVTLINIIMDI